MIRSQRQQTIDEAMDAYVAWREECARVWESYHRSRSAVGAEAALAYPAYIAALDREERASEVYAGLIARLARLVRNTPPPATEHGAPTSRTSRW